MLFLPGARKSTEFEVMGLPLPNNPIWLYAEELQLGGWHIAEIEVAPASGGLTEPPEPAGIVVGDVDIYSRANPVSGLPFVSTAVANNGCVLF